MSKIAEYEAQDALALATWVRQGEVTPTELLEEAVARVEARDVHTRSVVIPAFAEARKAIDAGLPEGPFRGVPYLLKDLYAAWKGMRLTNGSRFFADDVSDFDSELVARQLMGTYRVKSQDLLPIYQQVMHLSRGLKEFRIRHVPRAKNAHADHLANLALDNPS